MNNVKQLVELCAVTDEPIPFKGLFIYPVLVKDYINFCYSYEICTIDKNAIPDVEIISMSYLDYILSILIRDTTLVDDISVGMLYTKKLLDLLCLCFHVEPTDINIAHDGKHYNLIIKDIALNDKDFSDFIQIISYLNIYDYSDEYVDPNIKKAIDEYYSVTSKDLVVPDIEEKISYVTLMTGILKKDLLEISYREFEKIFHNGLNKIEYQINKQASMSGFVKFEKPIEHWVYKQKKSKYSDAFTSYDGFKNKIEKANG